MAKATVGGVNKTKLKKYNTQLQTLVKQYKSSLITLENALDHLLNDSRKADDGQGGIWSGQRAYKWVEAAIKDYNNLVDMYTNIAKFADGSDDILSAFKLLGL